MIDLTVIGSDQAVKISIRMLRAIVESARHLDPNDQSPEATEARKLQYKVAVQKTDQGFGNERVRGVGTGDRVIHTQERPAWDAKSRWPLPEEILVGKDKSWSAFHQQLEAATGGRYISPVTTTTKEKK